MTAPALGTLLLAAVLQTAPVSVQVGPADARVRAEEQTTLTVTVRDADGAPVPGARVRWVSATPEVASVDAQGRVTGLAPGQARIGAIVGGVSGYVTVQVLEAAPATLTVEVPPGPLYVGQGAPGIQTNGLA